MSGRQWLRRGKTSPAKRGLAGVPGHAAPPQVLAMRPLAREGIMTDRIERIRTHALTEVYAALIVQCGYPPCQPPEAEFAVSKRAHGYGLPIRSWHGCNEMDEPDADELLRRVAEEQEADRAWRAALEAKDQVVQGLVAPLATGLTDRPGDIPPPAGPPVIARQEPG